MRTIPFFLIFSLLLIGVSAQEDLPDPGTLPTSPLYKAELVIERLVVFFKFDEQDKITTEIAYSQERLAEMEKVSSSGRSTTSAKTEYLKNLKRAKEAADKLPPGDKKRYYDYLEQMSDLHILVLRDVKETAPLQAQQGLENAIENSGKYKEHISIRKAKTGLLDFDMRQMTPEQLREFGRSYGADGSIEAFVKAREAYILTGDEELAAMAFMEFGGTLPGSPEQFGTNLEVSQGEFVEFDIASVSGEELQRLAEVHNAGTRGSAEAYTRARDAYLQTGNSDEALRAFRQYGGQVVGEDTGEVITPEISPPISVNAVGVAGTLCANTELCLSNYELVLDDCSCEYVLKRNDATIESCNQECGFTGTGISVECRNNMCSIVHTQAEEIPIGSLPEITRDIPRMSPQLRGE